jgi:putative membrane protein
MFELKHTSKSLIAAAAMLASASAWAVGASSNGPASMPSDVFMPDALVASSLAAGSGALVPLMAADLPVQQISTIDASTPSSGGADKLVDDIAFVARATERGRDDARSARDALPQLKDPELKRLAETLAQERDGANAQLERIAAARDWPVPAQRRAEAPPAGRANADFDANWTDDMIMVQERSVALYSAQAQAGEDRELRKYARDTLPTLQHQLAELRRLQK